MIWSLFSRLLHDQRATSVIEMSFIIPVLVMLGCGATDLALCYARQLKLQQAAARAMEYAMATGYQDTLAASIKAEAATAAGLTATSTNPAVTVWLECNGVVQAAGVTSCTGYSPSRFASVTITDTYNWMFEQLVPAWNSQPYSVPLKGYAAVRIQ